MNKIDVGEFVRRLTTIVVDQEAMLAFFLGAGSSISSGIPGAATLTTKWLGQLHHLRTGGEVVFEDWVAEEFPSYDADNPAALYADVMLGVFPTASERQAEIEKIVTGKDPGFGYGALAQFMTRAEVGERCNVVFTTNFDDLVADALYLYTEKKPLVVGHEALARFVGARRTRPTIIKLHGDALLHPLNTGDEIGALSAGMRRALDSELRNRAIVFIGYGGNDRGVLEALRSLPEDALNWGVYWISPTVPDNEFGEWLEEKQATWVEHLDFDEVAALLHAEFDLPHPTDARFNRLLDAYRETFSKLQLESRADETTAAEVRQAVDKAQQKFESWVSVALEARKYQDSDPDRADEVFRAGTEQFEDSAQLLGSYANFLSDVREEMERAESYYQRAIEVDPTRASVLGNYAVFLSGVQEEMDQAESYYQRAIEADPNHASHLGNYAIFLKNVRKEMDQAESYYQRAIEADPNHATNLGNYASFLMNVRKEMDQAESYYRRAIEVDPNHVFSLGNYAGFLLGRGEQAKALELLRRFESLPDSPNRAYATLQLELAFCQLANVANDADEGAPYLREIRDLLVAGTRSPNWDFSANLDRARDQGHRALPMLEVLADVILEKVDIKALDVFEAWTELADEA